MQITAVVSPSSNRRKKYMADVEITDGGVLVRRKRVHFGGVRDDGRPYNDYTTGGNRYAYLSRHSKNDETWSLAGVTTPGFWSRWALWEKPTLDAALRALSRRFGIKIIKQ